jgi:PAS domain S-box-containing protein
MMKDVPPKGDTMERELRRAVDVSSEEKLRNILEKASECIIFLDKTGRILEVNRKTMDVFGYSKEEVLGKHFTKLDVLSIKDIPKVMKGFAKILAGKEATLDLTIKNKQGHHIVLECSGSLISSEGKFAGIMIIVRDVTAREHMHISLHHSEERYHNLVESIKDVLYSLDKEGNITSVNKAAKTLLGLEPMELIGKNILEFVPKEEASKVVSFMKPARFVGNTTAEIKIIDKNGQLHDVEFNSSPIMKDGKIVGKQGIVRDITKRKKIEEELRLSQERFRILFEYAPDAFYLSDLQGSFIDGNRFTEALFGYTKREFIGKTFFQLKLFARQDSEKITKLLAFNALEKPTGPDEFSMHCKDGTQIIVEISTYPVKIEGRVVVLGIAHDITERIKDEQALRESEEKYRNLFDLAPDGIATINGWGKITSINSAFSRLTGFSKEEVMGKNFTKIGTLRRRDIPRYLKVFAGVLLGKDVPYFEFPYQQKDGTSRWAEAHVGTLREKGKLKGILAYIRDTTERIESERSIRENKRKFEQLFMSNPEAAVYVDANFHILDINTRFTDLFDYSLKECLGEHIDALVVPKAKRWELNRLNRRVREGYTYHETVRQRKDGSLLEVSISSTPITIDDKPVGYIALYNDISERKRMENKLKEYSESLEALVEKKTRELKDAERKVAMGEIAAMVGHDLRNPLTGIAGAVYYLKTNLELQRDDTTKKMLELIEKNIEYSDKIINDLLDYSRKINLERTETTPQSIVTEILGSIQIPQTITIVDKTQREPKIHVDVQKMKRVFTNIITNARDAMPEGGTLTITTRAWNNHVVFTFTDTGQGIPEELIEKIWIPLFTTKAKGMGLGLAICRRMVEAHNGSISVKSKVGKGTTFTIMIPLKRDTSSDSVAVPLLETR